MCVRHCPARIGQFRLAVGRFSCKANHALLTLIACLCLLPAPALAAMMTSTTPLAEAKVIGSFAITPNGLEVVYIADQDTEGVAELYRVSRLGGASVKLNAPLVANGDVQSFLISADGNYVIYGADQDTDEQVELYSVPLAGGAAVKLNGPLIPNGNVHLYIGLQQVGNRILFLADHQQDEAYELFSAAIGGGSLVKLNQPLHLGPFEEFKVDYFATPDGSQVVYLADQEGNGDELYRVPIDGGPSQKLSAPLQAGTRIDYLKLSPDGIYVVYLVETIMLEFRELYIVPVAGGEVRKVNRPLANGMDVRWNEFTPDSQYMIYNFGTDSNSIPELYSVPIGGGTQVKLNTLVADAKIDWFASTPDSNRVVYVGGPDAGQRQLYSVPVAGGPVVHLNQSTATPAIVPTFSLDPIAGWVMFHTNEGIAPSNLYLVHASGGQPMQLNFPLGVDDSVGRAAFTPDGQFVIFEQGQVFNRHDVYLYAAPVNGGAVRQLAGPLSISDSGNNFTVSSDSAFVVYHTYQEATSMDALFVANLTMFAGDFHVHLPLIQP